MKLQNLLMPQAGLCMQQDMYFRLNKKVHVSDCQQSLTFRKHGVAWFDTYFNGFSIEKWKKYTVVREVAVTLLLKGRFEIQLCSKEKIHQTISERQLSVTAFDSEEITAVTLPFRSYEEKGMYFIRLEALEDGAQYWSGYSEGGDLARGYCHQYLHLPAGALCEAKSGAFEKVYSAKSGP